MLSHWRDVDRLPRGDGAPVLVLPGFLANAGSTLPLRLVLERLGHSPYCWREGRNLGLRGDLMERLLARLRQIQALHRRPVALVGWSLGGVFAREMARALPEATRLVITLGAPFAGMGGGTHLRHVYERISGHEIEPEEAALMKEPPPVPSTAIYTRSDGIVAWRATVEKPSRRTENVHVGGAHLALGFNPKTLAVVADRLALPDQRWRPFDAARYPKFFEPDLPDALYALEDAVSALEERFQNTNKP